MILLDTWCCFKIKQVSTDSASKKISYYWDQISILTRWHTRHTDFVLCLDMPSDMQKRLSLHLHSVNGRDAYAWLVVFLAEIRDRYDFSVWSLRHPVRDIEKVSEGLAISIRFGPEAETTSSRHEMIHNRISHASMRLRGISYTPTKP